ncbi:MAG TPA: tetratricopeptide repeat protein [Hyphomonadaceae bacterium]|nr:tetratricopeptide repeat protein [Hyphomonadaceae bacterium]
MDGKRYVLTDGTSDTLLALVTASTQDKGSVVAVNNPYLQIGFLLGSYYVETGDNQNAVRALDAGLVRPGVLIGDMGDMLPMLLMERGTALGQLKRHADAVASYERVIAMVNLPPALKAGALRGRANNLIDLGRLDEAEADLRASLQISPNHPLALNELKYIEELRAGKSKTDSVVKKFDPGTQPN